MPQPEAPAARSGAIQGAAYSESASNGASMPTPARSRFPKLAFFISLLGTVAPCMKTGMLFWPVRKTLKRELHAEAGLDGGLLGVLPRKGQK